jgi:acetylcholinesterase
VYKRGKATPFLGSFHGSDLAEFYGSATLPDFQGTDALVNFANNLNPNVGSGTVIGNLSTLIPWPKYSTYNASGPPLLTFLDPNLLAITPDTYRAAGMVALTNLSRQFP